jgi:uncharacterized membrane protein
MFAGIRLSFDSGRKLGAIASLIYVLLPLIVVAVMLFWFAALISSIPSIPSSGEPLFSPGYSYSLYLGLGGLSFVGSILFIISMHHLSRYYNHRPIFQNALYGFIINLVGGIVIYGVFFSVSSPILSEFQAIVPPSPASVFTLLVTLIMVFVAFLAVAIVSALFYMRSFNALAKKSATDNFKTAGLLYFIGAVLTIVIVGGILVWIAWLFAYTGFRSLKKPASTPNTQPPVSTVNIVKKSKCSSCGTENLPDALYCINCGKPLKQ